MKCEIEDRGDYYMVRCSGVFDSGVRTFFSDVVHPLIEDSRARILVDLAGVDRITSDGLSAMVTLVARANTKGSRVVFAAPSPYVQAVFEATRIDRFLQIEPTFEAGTRRLIGGQSTD